MALYLYYIDSVSPYLKDILQDVSERHIGESTQKSFCVLTPDLVSAEDVRYAFLSFTPEKNQTFESSVLHSAQLRQKIFEACPELPQLAEEFSCRKALFLALSQLDPQQEWKIAQCQDFLRSLRRWQNLKQLIQTQFLGNFKLQRLFQIYQETLLKGWNALAPENALPYLLHQSDENKKIPQLTFLKNLKEVIFLGFDYLSADLLNWIAFFEKYFPDCKLKLYLAPPQTLIDADRQLEATLKKIVNKSEQVTHYQALKPAQSQWRRFQAPPQEWQNLEKFIDLAFPDRGVILNQWNKLSRQIPFWQTQKNQKPFSYHLSSIPSTLPFVHLENLLSEVDEQKKVSFEMFYMQLLQPLTQSYEAALDAKQSGVSQYLEACLQKLLQWQQTESQAPIFQSYPQWVQIIGEEFKSLVQRENELTSYVRHYRAIGLKPFKELYFPDFCEDAFTLQSLNLPFIGEVPDPLQWHEMQVCLKKINYSCKKLHISFSEYNLAGRSQNISPYLDILTKEKETQTQNKPNLLLKSKSIHPFYEKNIQQLKKSQQGLQEKDFKQVPGLFKKLQHKLARKPLSASYIDQYLHCPWKFFARWQLKLDTKDKEKLEISPKDKGLWMHHIFEALLKQFHSSHFSQNKWPSLSKLCSALEKEITDFKVKILQSMKQENLPPVLIDQELQRIKNKVYHLLKSESEKWEKPTDFLFPYFFEWRFGEKPEDRLQFKLDDQQMAHLSGAIDRIDYNPQHQEFVVIDYKSSNSQLLASAMRQGLSLQLFIYLSAVKKLLLPQAEALGGLYWDAKSFKKDQGIVHKNLYQKYCEKVPSTQSFAKTEKFELTLAEMEARLIKTLKQIYQGEYPLLPLECGAKQCPYHQACHYAEQN